MFLVNVKKCLKLFEKVYVSSDDIKILKPATDIGAIPILRSSKLCGDTPNIPVYQHALEFMHDKPKGIIAVQANSPTIKKKVIKEAIRLLGVVDEVMTVHPDYSIYGSVWGIGTERLKHYEDPYKPKPRVVIVDDSIDIHTEEDYKKALSL